MVPPYSRPITPSTPGQIQTEPVLGFQPRLGTAWFTLLGWPFYQPYVFFWWWFCFDAYAHDIFVEGGYIAAAGGPAAFAADGV